MIGQQDIIESAYKAFNARDINALHALMDKDVDWPNGWEGGYVKGHDEVRAYWLRQWKEINPVVQPVACNEKPDGRIEVKVHQLVKDSAGNILFDGFVQHLYTMDKGKIKRMDIDK